MTQVVHTVEDLAAGVMRSHAYMNAIDAYCKAKAGLHGPSELYDIEEALIAEIIIFITPEIVRGEQAQIEALKQACDFKHNVLIHGEDNGYKSPNFNGRWVAIPREDFDRARLAVRGPQ